MRGVSILLVFFLEWVGGGWRLGVMGAAVETQASSRLVITFRTASDNQMVGDLEAYTVTKQYGRRLVLRLESPSYDLQVETTKLKRLFKNVQLVEVDHRVNVEQTDDLESASVYPATSQTPLWNLMDSEPYSIHVEGVWQITNSTPDVVVAVLDTGLAAQAQTAFLNLLDGYDFISDEDISIDEDGRDPDATDPGDWGDACPTPSWHGTEVASILAARHDNAWGMKGVAPNCSVLPVRVLGVCRTGYATDVTDAIVWAAGGHIDGVPTNPYPAKIISLSLIGQAPSCPDYLQSAVTQAVGLGAVVIAAAGNHRRNVSGYFPANCKGVVAVAASTRDGRLAGYSNWGSSIAVSAPGGDGANAIMTLRVNALETDLEVAYGMGTSFAVPHVAGVRALYEGGTSSDYYSSWHKQHFLSFAANISCTMVNYCGSGILSMDKKKRGQYYYNSSYIESWAPWNISSNFTIGQASQCCRLAYWDGKQSIPLGRECTWKGSDFYDDGYWLYVICWVLQDCPAGTYQDVANQPFCKKCPADTFSHRGFTQCVPHSGPKTKFLVPGFSDTCQWMYSRNLGCLCWDYLGSIWNENNGLNPKTSGLPAHCSTDCNLQDANPPPKCGGSSYTAVSTGTSFANQLQHCSKCFQPISTTIPANCASSSTPTVQQCYAFNACSGCGCYRNEWGGTAMCHSCAAGYYSAVPLFTACAACPSGSFSNRVGQLDVEEAEASAVVYSFSGTYPDPSCTQPQLDATGGAWCSSSQNSGWIQIDLKKNRLVKGFVTQGRFTGDAAGLGQHVKRYKITYSLDGTTWNSFAQNVYDGNYDSLNRKVNFVFINGAFTFLNTRYVRLELASSTTDSYHGHFSLRWTVLVAPLDSLAPCTLCEKGTFVAGVGAKACTNCPQGTFSDTMGAVSCASCATGTYSTIEGASVCSLCSESLPSNAVWISQSGSTYCTWQCNSGYFKNTDTTCTPVPSGTFYIWSSGTYSPIGSYCSSFGKWQITDVIWNFHCYVTNLCKAGTYSVWINQISCISCPAGTVSKGTTGSASLAAACTSCTAGTFSPSPSTACAPCGPGTYSGTGADACSSCSSLPACSADQYRNGCGGSSQGTCTNCVACNAGSYRSTACGGTNAGTCQKCVCPSAHYAPDCGGNSAGTCLTLVPIAIGQWCEKPYTGTTFLMDRDYMDDVCQVNSMNSCNNPSCTTFCSMSWNRLEGDWRFCCPWSVEQGCVDHQTWGPSYYDPIRIGIICPSGCMKVGGACTNAPTNAIYVGIGTNSGNCPWVCQIGSYMDAMGACRLCAAGTYSNEQKASACVRCTAGSYVGVAGASACDTCTHGTYSASDGAQNCASCIAGTYVSISGASTCIACAAGTFATATGATRSSACAACMEGTYASAEGTTECAPCAAGKYADTAGVTACTPCSPGTYYLVPVPGAFSLGFFTDTTVPCTTCAAGTYAAVPAAGGCDLCRPGTYAPTLGAAACTACEVGKYVATSGAVACEPCPPGSFVPGTGAASYQACPSGAHATASGLAACTVCAAGTYAPAGGRIACQACFPGTYAPAASAAACVACPTGLYTAASGATKCDACAAGAYAATTTTCRSCIAGTYSPAAGASACTACDKGKWDTGVGMIACATLCAAGTFASATGSTACAACPAARFTIATGATVCLISCAPGTFSTGTGLLYSVTTCALCAPGQYAPAEASSVCALCPSGAYSTGLGAMTCTTSTLVVAACASTSSTTITTLRPCPADMYCP